MYRLNDDELRSDISFLSEDWMDTIIMIVLVAFLKISSCLPPRHRMMTKQQIT